MSILVSAIIENHLDKEQVFAVGDRLNACLPLKEHLQSFVLALKNQWPRETEINESHQRCLSRPWTIKLGMFSPLDPATEAHDQFGPAAWMDCSGPHCSIYIHEKLAWVIWHLRWNVFCLCPDIRGAVLGATGSIVEVLGGRRPSTAVIVPDSTYEPSMAIDHLNMTLFDLQALLWKECGRPAEFPTRAPDLENFRREYPGYYVVQL